MVVISITIDTLRASVLTIPLSPRESLRRGEALLCLSENLDRLFNGI